MKFMKTVIALAAIAVSVGANCGGLSEGDLCATTTNSEGVDVSRVCTYNAAGNLKCKECVVSGSGSNCPSGFGCTFTTPNGKKRCECDTSACASNEQPTRICTPLGGICEPCDCPETMAQTCGDDGVCNMCGKDSDCLTGRSCYTAPEQAQTGQCLAACDPYVSSDGGCSGNGSCQADGTCNCDSGYTGTFCQDDA